MFCALQTLVLSSWILLTGATFKSPIPGMIFSIFPTSASVFFKLEFGKSRFSPYSGHQGTLQNTRVLLQRKDGGKGGEGPLQVDPKFIKSNRTNRFFLILSFGNFEARRKSYLTSDYLTPSCSKEWVSSSFIASIRKQWSHLPWVLFPLRQPMTPLICVTRASFFHLFLKGWTVMSWEAFYFQGLLLTLRLCGDSLEQDQRLFFSFFFFFLISMYSIHIKNHSVHIA